ncbi:hypothetical protein M5689_022920 [Euphorbia peplus]|nr:hypothetical protein M5689_022920 [Euphorbia peplus]
MGNSTSCTPSILISNPKSIKLFHSNGTLQIYTKPITAAVLMLENPNEFVCHFNRLKIGHRIQGLSADEELEYRQVYFLLPMDLLYSVLTQEEMGVLRLKIKKWNYHYLRRIFPVLIPSENKATEDFSSVNSLVEFSDLLSVFSDSGSSRSLCKQRSWTPKLETIVEAPSRSLSL